MHERALTDFRAGDRSAVVRNLALAFGATHESIESWMEFAGFDNLRVLRDGERPAACLLQIAMGQYFGGVSVPMLGVAGVAVAPEDRGRGHARALMHAFVPEAAAAGWPLAGLYASTHTLYRGVGFEHAGYRFRHTIPFAQLAARETRGRVVPLADDDRPEVRACHAAFGALHDGALDRGPYIWHRIHKFRGVEYLGFGARDDDGRLAGYLYLHQSQRSLGVFDILLSDLAFTEAWAGRRLIEFLANFAMAGVDLVFHGGPTHPLFELLPQQRQRSELLDSWLLRIVDVPRALAARGYSPAVHADVHLDVDDPLVPANHGRFVLRVQGGQAVVEPGGRGDLRTTARGLACMYSGYATPAQAAVLGLVSGEPAVLRAAAGVFAGGTPWMSDMF
ncbi:GNAT family N-acetyltransferase [Nannocystis sp. ILAH1]|uniref:GNAT family N-acetyltransferase n=1 Tax=unclassified Nannocystis TaxID=2627009 RepID=UPI002271B5C4|nr:MULTISPECIES: GNAT family N-acetyltransferase [unclassified Nannocystis]MCY0987701.1 GNAT family N-acetyltransferase [Nannocystis sp. ILAH1]MCY1070499.1 GNAT family N-acetyltransferase [Nannocystis sp. RBIL2]